MPAVRGRGVPGLTTAQFDEPMEPAEDCPASAVIEKKLDGVREKCEYLVEWKDPERDDSWEKREELIKNWPMRGAINQFEGLLLDEIKNVLQKEIERHKEKVPLTSLTEKLKAEYPYFKWNHLPMQLRVTSRNIAGLCRQLNPKWVVKPGVREGFGRTGGFIMTEEQAKEEDKKVERNKEKLKESFAELINVLRGYGGKSEISYVNSTFIERNPIFDQVDFGFSKFKEFVLACPGLRCQADHETQGANRSGLIVELVDDNPEELREVLKKTLRNEPGHQISAAQLPSMGGRPSFTPRSAPISLGIDFGARSRGEGSVPGPGSSRNVGYSRRRSRSRDRRRRRSRSRERRPHRKRHTRDRDRDKRKKKSRSPSSSPSSSRSKSPVKKKKKKKERARSSSSDTTGSTKLPVDSPWRPVQ